MFEKRPMRHVAQVEVASYHRVKRSIHNLASTKWFTGDEADIHDRLERIAKVRRQATAVLADPTLEDGEEAEVGSWIRDLDEEKDTLTRVVEELRAASYAEADNALPAYRASTYGDQRRTVAPNGEPTDSDWRVFVATRPKRFVASNATALFSAQEMRTRAYDYIEVQASRVTDDQERANIIDTFLARVERERRAQRNRAPRARKSANVHTAPRVDDRILFI